MSGLIPLQRRVELLERRLAEANARFESLARMATFTGKRWCYWAKTSEEFNEEEESQYPTSGNVLPIEFVDPTFIPTAGAQALSLASRGSKTVGCTANGQWLLPNELVMAIPIPPPPGTTGKGRWLLQPLQTYYWGLLEGPLSRLSQTTARIHRHDPAGTWTDSGFSQDVWEGRFLPDGSDPLPTRTWVRFEWKRKGWAVTNASCEPEPEEE
jgi:hypothetical protein